MFKTDHQTGLKTRRGQGMGNQKQQARSKRKAKQMIAVMPAVAVAGSPGFVKGVMAPGGQTIPYIEQTSFLF